MDYKKYDVENILKVVEKFILENKSLSITSVCDKLNIFDWWTDNLSIIRLKQMRSFLKLALSLGYTGYCCFKVGSWGCANGMWAHKEESTDGYAPKGEVLYRSFTPEYTYYQYSKDGHKFFPEKENYDSLKTQKEFLKYYKDTYYNLETSEILKIMKSLDEEAIIKTTDPKIYVGACVGYILNNKFYEVSRGCNCNYNYNERLLGKTYREFLFGSRDTKYRPWDKIIHAEENTIINSKINKYDTAIVTRYPCDKCAQLLIYKGIKTVYYGRETEISEHAKELFSEAGVKVIHIKQYQVDESLGAEKVKSTLEEHKNYLRRL